MPYPASIAGFFNSLLERGDLLRNDEGHYRSSELIRLLRYARLYLWSVTVLKLMIVNHTHKFIFVHVPKTAGSSVTSFLSELSCYCDQEVGGTNLGEAAQSEYIRRFGLSKHANAEEIRRVTGDAVWTRYFKFGFVRNPYERAYSAYKFMLQMCERAHPAYARIAEFPTFEAFLTSEYFQTPGPDRILNAQRTWFQGSEVQDNLAVDYVGYVDDLDASMRTILARIRTNVCLDPKGLLNINESGNEQSSVWQEINARPQLEEIIFRRYEVDFVTFGFQRGQAARTARATVATPVTAADWKRRASQLPAVGRGLIVCGGPSAATAAVAEWLGRTGSIGTIDDLQLPAQLVFVLRDPFAAALDYKQRSMDDLDASGGTENDVAQAATDWNRAAHAFLEYAARSGVDGASLQDRCFLLSHEEFVSNCCDRYGLTEFLGGIDLPELYAEELADMEPGTQHLSPIEIEMLRQMLDWDAHAALQAVLRRQKRRFAARRFRREMQNRREWYHGSDKRDAAIDYGEFQIPGCDYVFRGRRAPGIPQGRYGACVGSATTFGRFVREPFPTQIEAHVGMPCLNLGIGGGRPESFLINDAIVGVLSKAEFVILEIMSARGCTSPIFEAFDPVANVGFFKDFFSIQRTAADSEGIKALIDNARARKPVFVDRVYEWAARHLTPAQRDMVRDALVQNYLRDCLALVEAVGRPVIALYLTRNAPFAARLRRKPSDYAEWSGDHPHFVDEHLVAALEQHGVPVVVARSQRGFPFPIANWHTGEPASVFPWQPDKSLNTYYPSQEMHDDAARLLLEHPLIRRLSAT